MILAATTQAAYMAHAQTCVHSQATRARHRPARGRHQYSPKQALRLPNKGIQCCSFVHSCRVGFCRCFSYCCSFPATVSALCANISIMGFDGARWLSPQRTALDLAIPGVTHAPPTHALNASGTLQRHATPTKACLPVANAADHCLAYCYC